jgi:hypothetical protein
LVEVQETRRARRVFTHRVHRWDRTASAPPSASDKRADNAVAGRSSARICRHTSGSAATAPRGLQPACRGLSASASSWAVLAPNRAFRTNRTYPPSR